MEGKNKVRSAKRRRIIIIIIIMGALASAFYLRQLDASVHEMTVASIEELAVHDMKSISAKIDDLWGELDAVYYRTTNVSCTSIQDLCDRLNLERASNIFDTIYLLDEDGYTYSSTNVIKDQSSADYVQRLLSGKEQVIRRHDSGENFEYGRDRIVYGVRCEPFTCDGITFIGILGEAKNDTFRSILKISSFGGQGYTSIIDMNGNYLLNQSWKTGISDRENYFDTLRTDAGLSDEDIERIKTRINEKETFSEQHLCQTHGTEIVSYFPMEKAEWAILITVPESVLTEQATPFVHLSLVMLIIMILLVCVASVVVLWMMSSTMTVRAEARAKEDFVSSMSHEIRTPLTSIIGLNNLMQEHLDDPERMADYLHKCGTSARYLLALVNDILDLAKLQSGKIDLENAPFSLDYFISAVESIIGGSVEQKQIDFRVETDLLAPNLEGDEVRIQQILLNILGNAVKFTPEGGRVTLRISQREAHGGMVETTYEVEDTGCGMSSEFMEQIFAPFAQERRKVSDGTQGTGLGMAISHLLTTEMGGTLSVQSKLGEGSCFTLKLTNKVSATEPQTVLAPQEEPLPEVKTNLNILVAEDNELNAEILVELLQSAGFTVARAADGGQVVEMFQASGAGEYDCILMDIQMPVRNGYEATRIIRAMKRPDAKTVKIFACTANVLQQDRDQAAESGMDDFIPKPVDVKGLLEKLSRNRSTEVTGS